ncbi:MAG: pirin family protein [Pseudomonadota bacterium]|nr:MAG: pirin family protein [Pseudomonadota bacterium]
MIVVRKSKDRGRSRYGWLDSRHTFSFANYFDPERMGISALRVINDDTVAPGAGFGTHGHRNMEIISYVLDGALEHRDNIGNGSVIRPGEVQRMSAGTGVTHSEYNASGDAPVHFLQIWMLPDRNGYAPSYEQKAFPYAERHGRLCLLASPDGRDGSLRIHQDARLYGTQLTDRDTVSHPFEIGRQAFVHVVSGTLTVNGEMLSGGDGAIIRAEGHVTLTGKSASEVLLFDLP